MEPAKELIPLGIASGIRLFCQGAAVVGINEVETDKKREKPAKDAGIKPGDIITSINGVSIGGIDDVIAFMEECTGEELKIGFMRGNVEKTASILPALSRESGKYKLGLTIRDSEAGIGTLTYLNPLTGAFGGLGHGIQDPNTGRLFDMARGDASNVIITGIIKGYKDEPGEITGMFLEDGEKTGDVYLNTENGVYGKVAPDSPLLKLESFKTAQNDEITVGKAEILSNILSDNVEKFEIEIEKVYNSRTNNSKNMLIRIVDKRLLNATGGIIQGMSGSPIIQNGKLVGAVTHVLVHDPTRGYAISIENMLADKESFSNSAYAA